MTFIQVLIGVSLGSMILLGAMQGYYQARMALSRQQQLFRQLDAGGMAIQYLIRDIEASGYRGCRSTDRAFPFYRQDSEFHSAYPFLHFDRPVSGFFASAGACCGKLPESGCKRLKTDSSVLILYNIAQPAYRLKKPLTSTKDPIEIDQKNTLHKNTLVLIADCKQADVFIANRLNKGQVFHEKIFGVNRSEHLSKIYDYSAEILELQTVAYYVGVPERFKKMLKPPYYSLFREDFLRPAIEIVTGVENLEVLYGLYHPETGQIIYLSAGKMKEEEWAFVQSVKINLVALDKVTGRKKTWKAAVVLRNRVYFDAAQPNADSDLSYSDPPNFTKSITV